MTHLTDTQRFDAEELQVALHQPVVVPRPPVIVQGHEWKLWTSLKISVKSLCSKIAAIFHACTHAIFSCAHKTLSCLEAIFLDDDDLPLPQEVIGRPNTRRQADAQPLHMPVVIPVEPIHPVIPISLQSALFLTLCHLKTVRDLSPLISTSSTDANEKTYELRRKAEQFRALLRTMDTTIQTTHRIPQDPLDATTNEEFRQYCEQWQKENAGKPLHIEQLFLEFALQRLYLPPMQYNKNYIIEEQHRDTDLDPMYRISNSMPVDNSRSFVSRSILLNVPNGTEDGYDVDFLLRQPFADDFVPPPPQDPTVVENPKDEKPPVEFDGRAFSFTFSELPDLFPFVINRYDMGHEASVMPQSHIMQSLTLGKTQTTRIYRLKALVALENSTNPNQYVVYKPTLVDDSFVKYNIDGTIVRCPRHEIHDVATRAVVYLYEKERTEITRNGRQSCIEHLKASD